jgi:hypothetical protein
MAFITLDVGGQIFKTDHPTIIKIPYFQNMFEDCGNIPQEVVFVNRPAHIFKHVLALAIDPLYPYPKKYTFELDFYGVNYESSQLYDVKQDIIEVKNIVESLVKSTKPSNACKEGSCKALTKNNRKYCEIHIFTSPSCNVIGCVDKRGLWQEFCINHEHSQRI